MRDIDALREQRLDYDGPLERIRANRPSGLDIPLKIGLQHLDLTPIGTIQALQECLGARQQFRVFLFFRLPSLRNEIEKCARSINTSGDLLSAAMKPKDIYEKPLHLLGRGDEAVDITSSATPQRYRLVDCKALTESTVLCICEFTDFPVVDYCAISYVWRNIRTGKSFVEGGDGVKFDVKGAEKADPINTDVLYHACMASLRRGCTHLWLDRLCIMQASEADKPCVCVVLAGGLEYMVSLEEETAWIHRGWTLQEALAPPIIDVLFAWKLHSGQAIAATGVGNSERLEEVVPNQSAVTSLSLLLKTCTTGVMSFVRDGQSKPVMVEAKIFSSYPVQHSYNDIPFWRPTRKIFSPNVAALCIAMDNDMDEDTKLYAIWKSALMRTSSRPVDMVLSVMGLFGVTLDPSPFGKDDRLNATIALACAILEKGSRATWLGTSFKLPPCKQLPTFSVFPRTQVAGKALFKGKEVSEMMDNEYHYPGALVPFPQGSMDKSGFFTFAAKAVRVMATAGAEVLGPLPCPLILKAKDGSLWRVCDASNSQNTLGATFAVLLGWFNAYVPNVTPAHDADNIRAMLVTEHAAGKFHVLSYVFLSMKCRPWVTGWEVHSFCIGPETPSDTKAEPEEELVEVTSPPDLQLQRSAPNFPECSRPTLMDTAARQARWAVPQHTLERHYEKNIDSL
ncbi:hypothetical protein EDD18DRAFT_1388986 [Armillaria luteobubalina]|uniref:Heterokaryon incompatibility domain-containing protein n=1 Tax=Armillaria luteobubalina TaxID=153913 RepID=A0AA39Q5D1_9AGAR|nr:hypothetical protein EDD18DRAFT_1388986 [Armillaria luteobubalina]